MEIDSEVRDDADVIDELNTGTAGDDATEMAVNVGKDAGGAKTAAAAAATAVTGGENEQLDADVETPEESLVAMLMLLKQV